MASLKRQIRRVYGDKHWVVLGPNGAVDWGLVTDSSLYGDFRAVGVHSFRAVGVHSPRPQTSVTSGGPFNDCPHLETACYLDCLHVAGENLGEAWEAAGRDDAVIWPELEGWYARRLAGLVAEAGGR